MSQSNNTKTKKVGVADTMFACVNMGKFAVETLEKAIQKNKEENKEQIEIVRYTVPGFKDLPVASKKLIEEHNCDIVIACGMAGPMPIDKQCAHEASLGLCQAQLMTNTHILEVFVHEDEAEDEQELFDIAKNRTVKHTENALALLKGKTTLTPFAGQGKRQGKEDRGPVKIT